jgi:hypothetical protein
MTLYKKLLHIQSHVDRFIQDGKGQNYTYTKGSTVLNKIRPLMNEQKILLKQEVISIDNTREDYTTQAGKVKNEILSKVMMKFTWIDVESGATDENLFGANGMNDWDKGFGSALTYAERYFLLKFFHVPTDEDDVDASVRETLPNPTNHPTKHAKAWLNPGTEEWTKAKTFIDKSTDKEAALKATLQHYNVSKDNQTKLLS